MSDVLLTPKASRLIKELIGKGWSFMLAYDDMNRGKYDGKMCWSADFTRRLKSGKYDNHKDGISFKNPSYAVKKAYWNVKNHNKVRPRGKR